MNRFTSLRPVATRLVSRAQTPMRRAGLSTSAAIRGGGGGDYHHHNKPVEVTAAELAADRGFEAGIDPKVSAKLSKDSGVPENLVNDLDLHVLMIRTQRLFDMLGVPEAEEEAFLKQHSLSPGFFSQEWAWPSPPPAHTNEELPLIKEHPERETEGAAAPAHH